jgi:calcineurin-like phosphoesterase family protein
VRLVSVPRILTAALVAAVLVTGATACGGEGKSGAAEQVARASGIESASSNKPVVVWAVGDGADGEPYGRHVGRLIERGNPDRFLYLGDVYEEGTAKEFKDNYAPVFGKFADITAPTPGNHEWGRRDEGYRPYWKSILGKDIPDYYRFKVGGWEILSLNSEAPHDEGSPQVRWLRSNLPGDGTCRLAFWHRPRYSFGDHGDQPDIQPLWNALRGRAVLIVNGHEHNTERFAPRDGITELVAGEGGRGIYEITPEERAQLAYGNDTDFGALRLKLRPGRADYRFVAVSGKTLDSGSVRCKRATESESQPVSAF